MFVAPLPVPPSAEPRRIVARPDSDLSSSKTAMALWLLAGLMAIIAVPAARGDAALGGTLPFWLVAAPVINLLWIERRRWSRALAAFARRPISRRTSARNVRRQRSLRSAACSAVRS
jgi:hypothetical protein